MEMKDIVAQQVLLPKLTDINLLGGISAISYISEVTDETVRLIQLDTQEGLRREVFGVREAILPFSLINENYLYIVLEHNERQEICRVSHNTLVVENWPVRTLNEFDMFEATDDRYIVFRAEDLPGDAFELIIMDVQLHKEATITIVPEDDYDFNIVTDIYKRPTHIVLRRMNNPSSIEFMTWGNLLSQLTWI